MRLLDVPVITDNISVVKGFYQSVAYLQGKDLTSKLYPDNKVELNQNLVMSEWTMSTFFPISSYFSYGNEKNFTRLKKLMLKSDVFSAGDESSDRFINNLRLRINANLNFHPIFHMSDSHAIDLSYSRLQVLSDALSSKRFIVRNEISLADLTAFGVIVRLLYGSPELYAYTMSHFTPIISWIERVDQLSSGPNTIRPFCLR